MVNLEIEILSADAKNDVYELRNYLEENIENLQIAIKEQAAIEGQMSPFNTECIINGVIHAGVGIGMEQCIHVVWALIKEWKKRKNKQGDKKIEVLATLGDDTSSVIISEDSEGRSERYDNVVYSIDIARTRAVLIGCGEFENDFPPIPPVKGNLEDLCRLLSDKRNIGLLHENITVAFNKSSTEIEELLLRISRLPDTETLLIYFSGHGYRSDVDKLHLIASNTRKFENYILSGIDYDFIKNVVLKSSPAKQKIVILDACHSGIATQGAQDTILDVDVTGTYILASSESDEVSYFDKNKRNTFFTGALLETLSKGIDNEKEMLALNDLYENTRNRLDQKQQPRFNNKLTISPAFFFVARNPSFSLEKNIQKATQLYRSGKLANALTEYKKVLQRQPDNEEVKKLADQCNNDLLFIQFRKEGDELFYQRRHYKKALELYQQAYELKPDFSIAEKISNCKDYLDAGHTGVLTDIPKPSVKPPLPDDRQTNKIKPEEEDDDEKLKENGISKKVLALIITAAVIGIGWLLLTLFKTDKDATSIQELSKMLSTDPGKAVEKLLKVKQQDSANYVLGDYFRDEERFDTAAYFYKKAITASHLPAAYSALGVMYYNGNLKDSNDKEIAYSILKTADSLFKADTTAYYYMAQIMIRRQFPNNLFGIDNYELYEEAGKFFLKGIKKDCKKCVAELAFLYLKQGNTMAAFPYMKKAAENNFAEAQVYLSDMLENGNGTAIDKVEADKWFKLFIANADPDAIVEMGTKYFLSYFPHPDEYKLEKNCKRAAELYLAVESKVGSMTKPLNKRNLYQYLGEIYENGCDGYISKDLQKAINYYRKGAEMGDFTSASQLKRLKVK